MTDGKRQNAEAGSLMTERSLANVSLYGFYFYFKNFLLALSLLGGKGSGLVMS